MRKFFAVGLPIFGFLLLIGTVGEAIWHPPQPMAQTIALLVIAGAFIWVGWLLGRTVIPPRAHAVYVLPAATIIGALYVIGMMGDQNSPSQIKQQMVERQMASEISNMKKTLPHALDS